MPYLLRFYALIVIFASYSDMLVLLHGIQSLQQLCLIPATHKITPVPCRNGGLLLIIARSGPFPAHEKDSDGIRT